MRDSDVRPGSQYCPPLVAPIDPPRRAVRWWMCQACGKIQERRDDTNDCGTCGTRDSLVSLPKYSEDVVDATVTTA